ncbi:MAG: choice-of-anchor D domain-containing protein, partial [Melioribacteraceae bacterium]|nr:choice-of-anchor D domain-containing protein [Melioribacteraceae bacterium]
MINSNKFSTPVIGFLVFISTLITNEIKAQAGAPTVSTTAVLEFASTAAIMGGNATSDGGAAIFARGVVYSSTDTTPEIEEAGVTAEPNESGTGVFSELIGPLLPGTTYYVQAYAANSEGTSHGGVQSFTTKQGPEINLVGNGNSISDGDDSPSATDHTDFGNMSVDAGTVVRTFTIQNTGDMTLTLDSTSPYVSISGTHTGDFSVTATPNNSINAGGSTTFNITFNPSGAGTRSAAISIDNNDINEDPYNFDIQGTGINISAPSTQANSIVFSNVHAAKLSLSWTSGNGDAAAVFVMEGSSGSATPVNDISYTADPIFGAGDQIGSTGWYCVYNGTGTSTNVYGIRPGSTYRLMVCEYNDDSGFIRYNSNTAASNPLNQALPYLFINEIDSDTPGADVAEFVELYDGGAGNTELDYLTVVFFNGSSDESYRKFDLDGESTDVNGYLVIGNAGVSGVDITFANSGLQNGADAVALYVADGTDFPSGTAVTTTGLIDAIVYDTDDADDAGLLVLLNGGQPQVNENFVSNSENYSLQRIPNGTGGYRNTNSYTVDFPTPDNSNGNPDMQVLGNAHEIADGDATPSFVDETDFGSADIVTGSVVRTYTIKNIGEKSLTLTGGIKVVLGGTDAADFSVSQQPNSPVASGGGTTTFQVTFNPSTTGLKSATISIDNDDPDENPYNYSIQGTATSTPEMKVEGNTNEIVDGDDSPSYSDHTIFGSVVVNGGTIFRTFTIKNIGAAPLNLTGSPRVVINGADAAEFSVTSQPNSPISGGGGDLLQKNYTINNGGIEGNFTAFQITFNPSSTGIKNATVSIDNDDPDENPYDFAIQGTGTGIPEISVEGNSIIIVDGDVTPSTADHTDFGTPSEAGGSVTRIFTIKNSGSAELTLAGTPKVSVSGTHATDFTVTVFPTSPVAALNGSTTFKITFTPSASGVRSAALSIPNDDGDENPYNFSIRGTAQFPPTGGNDNVTLNEDSSYTFTVADFTFNDADGDTFDGIKLLSLETAGDLEYNGADVTAPSDYADVTKLVFTPEENESGSPYAEFTFKVKDSHGDYSESSYTMSIEVTSINDAPSFTASDPSAVNEDTGLQTITNWASFDAGPDDEDASQNVLGYSISNINNPGLFAVMPSLETNGTLSYTPATNAFGVTTFDVTVQDDGGTTNGGVDISDTKSFTITIININDQPGFTAADPPATLEDTGSQTIVDWASFDAGPDNEDATQSVLAYALTNISNPGLFSAIPSIGIDGTLTYTPSANAFGISTFDVVVQDDGGTTDGGVDISDTQSFTITITSVNDQPIFTAIDPPAILEDAGLQTIVDWASFDAGPDDEDATQSVLGYTITNIITPGLFSAIPSVGTDGTLTYTPAQNVFGTTTFDVIVQDDGGTTNGGIDLSVVQTFTISVIGINDPPTTTGISDVFVDEDAPNTVIDLTQSFNDAEDGSSGLSYTVENVTNNNLFNNVNINNGELTLAYASNQFGTSDITIRAEDSGSLTVESIFTINVISINDPPVFTNGGLPDIEFNEDENASIN